jgi:phosphatidate cytidylyltransferase
LIVLRWRLVLSLLLVPLLGSIAWLDAQADTPGTWLAPFALAITVAAAGELIAIARRIGYPPPAGLTYLAILCPAAGAAAALLTQRADPLVGISGGLAVALTLVAGASILVGHQPSHSLANLGATMLGTLYVGSSIGWLIALRGLVGQPDNARGFLPLLSLVVIVKASDIGQYACGRSFGKHPLAPRISPGKTWEGFLGGLATAGLVAALVLPAWFPLLPYLANRWQLLLLGCLLCVAGVAGDLFESHLKRAAQLKDSSTWLPGFGGVLDLIDSLLLAAPVAYAWWVIWGKLGATPVTKLAEL